jgi:Trk K+ transport system NAD-binding subunit
MKKEVLVFGYNAYAKEIIKNFIEDEFPVQVWVIDEQSFFNAKNDGISVRLVELDDDWLDIQRDFNIQDLICFCSLDDDAQNVFLTISLRAEYKQLHIIALATSKESGDKLRLAGANRAIAKLETTAIVIVESLEKPGVVRFMNDILYSHKDLKLAEYVINKNSLLEGSYLHEIQIHKRFNILILAISSKELESAFTFVAQGHNHLIDAGNVLVVMGRENDLLEFEEMIK